MKAVFIKCERPEREGESARADANKVKASDVCTTHCAKRAPNAHAHARSVLFSRRNNICLSCVHILLAPMKAPTSGTLLAQMSGPPQARSPLDNPTANSAFSIITGRKASNYAKYNTGTMYQTSKHGAHPYTTRNELLEFEPLFTLESRDSYVDDQSRTELPVLSCLAGLPAKNAAQVDSMVRFVGFARGETANEHVAGNANGTVAIICHGVLTVLHTGLETISPGALVCIRAPTEGEAERQVFTGRLPGKPTLLLEEYIPKFDDIDATTGFSALATMLGAKVNSRQRTFSQAQLETYDAWWTAMRTLISVGVATLAPGGASPAKTYNETAKKLGLLGFQTEAEKASQAGAQLTLLKRLFVKDVANGVAQSDMNKMFFQMPKMGESQVQENNTLAQLQVSAIPDLFSAIISGHANKQNSIIGKTPSGGVSGGSLDLVMWRT